MKAWILLVTLILLLAGCTTSVRYVKADATDVDFEEDHAECTQQILQASIEANLEAESSGSNEKDSDTPIAKTSLRQRIDQCLQSKGWKRERRSE